GAGNLIAGNDGSGVHILTLDATQTLIQGNLIGTNAAGTGALGNKQYGVYFEGNRNGTLGGIASGARNVIAANGSDGVLVAGGNEITVQGNFIGTDNTGAAALANVGQGLAVNDAFSVTVGGTTAAARN